MKHTFTGGCLCGAVRYESSGDPLLMLLCHCSQCQKATGGAFMPVVVAKSDGLRVTKGETRAYHSSESAMRHFCPNCGTPIFFERRGQPEWRGIIAGTLDDQSQFAPRMHVWSSRMVPWLHLADDLPRHAEFPPQG